jgi:ABC-type transport system involved in multi-copper enzyme maturation permease subunit
MPAEPMSAPPSSAPAHPGPVPLERHTVHPLKILARDELRGFARSKVMLVLWVVLPILVVLGFWLLGERIVGRDGAALPVSSLMTALESSVAGTVAALMIGVDLVTERNRNVYVLFAIRPIRREAIVWAKFLAVFACVTIACVVSLVLGVVVDLARGLAMAGDAWQALGKSLVSMVAAIGLATAAGALFGVLFRSVLIVVILGLYVCQNITIVPMLPVYFHVLPNLFWLDMVISYGLLALLLWLAGVAFRRSQL